MRIAVCQELCKEVQNVLCKNDVGSWMRLLAFPYIVLNNRSKGKDGINVIRYNLQDNLNIFRNCSDINDALNDVLRIASIPFKVSKAVDKDSVIVKTATRKVSEGDIRGAVRDFMLE